MRIGDRGVLTHAVASRTWIGARALRSHAQQAAFIYASDRSASSADRVNVEHRHAHRHPTHGSVHGQPKVAFPKADVGGCAAHVEVEGALEAAPAGGRARTHHAACRPGKNGAHSMPARFTSRNIAAVRLQNGKAVPGGPIQIRKIGVHEWPDIRVDQGCRSAFVLAKLGRNFVRTAEVVIPRQGARRSLFVFRVFVRV